MNSDAREALLRHYDRERRDLPWRGEADPYRVLVSEVMLQQTRVQTVLDYYGRWLEWFPDIGTLAEADVDDVLRVWEGLGYYRRARNLHRAAQVVRDKEDGRFPSTYATLRELPGVGEYTAGAVASIAFGEAVPAVDGNVRRVFSRFFDEADPRTPWLRARAREALVEERPGDWNQALMELGATVCTPRGPKCDVCPLELWCAAKRAGTQSERPVALRKGPARRATFVLGVFVQHGRLLLERRPEQGLLGGMWAFPEVELVEGQEAQSIGQAAVADLAARFGLRADGAASMLPIVVHRFTHIDATYVPFLLPASGAAMDDWGVGALAGGPPGVLVRGPELALDPHVGSPHVCDDSDPTVDRPIIQWVEPERSSHIAIPRAQRRVMETVLPYLLESNSRPPTEV